MRVLIAIGLGIAVLTGFFVLTKFYRGSEIAVLEAASPSRSGAALIDTSRSATGAADSAITSGMSSSQSSDALRTSPVTADKERVSDIDPAVRAQNRAEGNARINAQSAGNSVPNPVISDGGANRMVPIVGTLEADIATGNSPSTISGSLPGQGGAIVAGPLPGEDEPEVHGPLPGEGEPQVYGPLPGENDPQVLGPLPGEGEPELPLVPLPGEG